MFPSQDELTPIRPLGNLIALPFQGKAAQNGYTLFLDPGTDFQQPFSDQLEVLKSIVRVPEARLDEIINDWGLVRDTAQPKQSLPGKPRTKTVTPTATGKIPQGRRNTTLTSIAGSLRRNGMEFFQIKEVLLQVNQNQCEPPLMEAEVEKIAESISSRYAAGPGAADQQNELDAAKKTLVGLADKVKADAGVAFEPSILLALRVVKSNDPGEWARIRKSLQAANISMKELGEAIRHAHDRSDGTQTVSMSCPYLPIDGVLARRRQTDHGEVVEPLCNFTASLVREKVCDDGLDKTTIFEIEGARQNGQPLPPIEVPASQFAGMSWVTANCGDTGHCQCRSDH